MTANLDFYYTPVSGPCQAVLMTAKTLGVTLNRKLLDMKASEHLKPEFLKLNPQHIVPTLVDNGFVLWESRAIMAYLVEQYGKTDNLYPKCPQKRAQINQRLYFDLSMQANFREYYFPIFMKQQPNPELFKKVQAAFDLLNTFLEGTTYAVGDTMTLADIAFVATVSTFDVSGFEVNKYPNVEKWYKKCQATMPGWEENWEGCLERSAYFK